MLSLNYFFIFSEERKWRRWVDEVFVHVLSPNVYRTIDESYRTFRWFSDVSVNSFSLFFLSDLKIYGTNDTIEIEKGPGVLITDTTNKIKVYFILYRLENGRSIFHCGNEY